MNYGNPLKAYQFVSHATSSGPEIEAAALTKAALRLKECQDNWDGPNRDEILYGALKYNQKIWTIFQVELSAEGCPLPKPLRLNMLRLAAFVDKRSFQILAFPERQKISILIDINHNIAAGLRDQMRQNDQPSEPEPALAATAPQSISA